MCRLFIEPMRLYLLPKLPSRRQLRFQLRMVRLAARSSYNAASTAAAYPPWERATVAPPDTEITHALAPPTVPVAATTIALAPTAGAFCSTAAAVAAAAVSLATPALALAALSVALASSTGAAPPTAVAVASTAVAVAATAHCAPSCAAAPAATSDAASIAATPGSTLHRDNGTRNLHKTFGIVRQRLLRLLPLGRLL